jgi:hypothetical protein
MAICVAMTSGDQNGRPTRPASPWWPRREPWRTAPPVQAAPAPGLGPREAQLAPAPPPSPPLFNRIAGAVLLAATLGLASCQAFLQPIIEALT